jgi:hypothetical protein
LEVRAVEKLGLRRGALKRLVDAADEEINQDGLRGSNGRGLYLQKPAELLQANSPAARPAIAFSSQRQA